MNLGLDSTKFVRSDFTLIDKYNNVLSATSSIENSFGSRLFTNGFFLNNQLTDFSFKNKDNSKVPLKNLPVGEKRPLSSMSPMIVFDTENKFHNSECKPNLPE